MSAPPAVTIRPLTADDHAAVCVLWTAAGLPFNATGRESAEAFTDQVARFPEAYLAAVDGDRIVGTVLGTHDGRKGWINRLAVHPEYRRHGLARLLLEACENVLRADGIQIFAALIEGGNEDSCRFFEHNGYAEYSPVVYYRKKDRPDI